MEEWIMAYEELKSSGITSDTPKNIMFGAGTIHKGFTYATSKWNFEESLIGATQGGSKLTITPEVTNIEVDGALVKVEGLAVKTGETATMEVNFVELTPEILEMVTLGESGTATDVTGYSEIKSKARIEAGDYVDKLAYVGHTLEGKPIIVIFDKALCTTGLELEGKNKENGIIKATFECYATFAGSHETLPWHIYYPTPAQG